MFYIFDSNAICICCCGYEPNEDDLKSRGEFFIESEEDYELGASVINGIITNPKPVIIEKPSVEIDYTAEARKFRDYLRSNIDKYLMPASTIDDTLVTEEQKDILIQDSLLLATWPKTEKWPYVELPLLSELCNNLLNSPVWEYPDAS